MHAAARHALPHDAPETPRTAPRSARYTPVDRIGRGGGGEVWRVHDALLRRDVALKVVPWGRVRDSGARADLVFEARVGAALCEPCVPPVHDVGTLPDGRAYFTMACVEGPTLRQVISERAGGGGPRLETLVERLAEIADTVGRVHRTGLLHRDIKPSNILVASDRAYLADWGAAWRVGEPLTDDAPGRRASMGTLPYVPPEGFDGDPGNLGPEADVYALGVILFELLTGEVPFDAPTPMGIALKARCSDAPDVRALNPDAPEALAELCRWALVRQPAARLCDARVFARRLRGWLARLV